MTDGINDALSRPGWPPKVLQFGDEAQIREIKRREAWQKVDDARQAFLSALSEYSRRYYGREPIDAAQSMLWLHANIQRQVLDTIETASYERGALALDHEQLELLAGS